MDDGSNRRVLSIQSHVVRGHVGNKAAVFPLQLLGFDVDFINSVQFSNHTAYSSFRGERLDGPSLTSLVDGLVANDLVAGEYSHILTGYIGSLSFLRAVAGVVSTLRAGNPELVYVCDPVLGDAGKLYVPHELVAAYKDEIIPLANTVTPNAFEAEQLTGLRVTSVAEAAAACDALHGLGPSTVVVTSLECASHPGQLLLVGSTRLPQDDGCPPRFVVRFPKRGGYWCAAEPPRLRVFLTLPRVRTGTGDLLAALLLARAAERPRSLAAAAEAALASVQGVLARTASFASAPGARLFPAGCELRLIQSAGDITSPTIVFRAEALP